MVRQASESPTKDTPKNAPQDTPSPRPRGRRAHRVTERKTRFQGWRTSDAEEIERRRLRAVHQALTIEPLEPQHPVFGTFEVSSDGGGSYPVEIRSLTEHLNTCGCADHRVNRLGTCKHVEAVLASLRSADAAVFDEAARKGSRRVEIFLDTTGERPEVRILWPSGSHARSTARTLLEPFFSTDGLLLAEPAAAVPALARQLEKAPARVRWKVRFSRFLLPWAEERARSAARQQAREAFLTDLAAGKRSLDVVRHPLYPYQREGVLHLAFTERAILGDEMGLGKTVQAIAACALLRKLRGVERVLVVSPASLKAEWLEQIGKFTGLPARLVAGPRAERLRQYRDSSFFYLTNYEQILGDGDDIQRLLAPDVIILDEAQRIKNWRTKTAQAVKRLESPYAFVLTGTPVENRIDDIYSISQFLDPGIFGPLFRFNRDFYELDNRGRPVGYKNLGELHRRLKPILLRRRKADVEDELPGRTVNTYFVEMSDEQIARYEDYNGRVAKLLHQIRRRPMTQEEFEKLQRWLACMRMLCDTPYILDPECRECPKLGELEEILGEIAGEDGHKVLVFSEWQRMLELVRELAEEMELGYAWHTGSVPQTRRREEIERFKRDPECRLFLSTDSGSVGLNLQAASVVINLDLPWNPARLEQRIARAWRKHQTRPVQVIHLVSEGSIEHRMLGLLAGKQKVAESVLDGGEDLDSLPLPSGRAVFLERLEEIMGLRQAAVALEREAAPEPAAVVERVHQDLVALLDEGLLLLELHANQEGEEILMAVVDRPLTGEARARIEASLTENGGDGGSAPRLELLDRATFETVQRLIEQGVLQRAPAQRRTLHRSAVLADPEAAEQRRYLAEARSCFEAGERKRKMAVLLAGGGFAAEAVAPLGEAVEGAVACLAHLEGRSPGEGEAALLATLDDLCRRPPPLGALAGDARDLVTCLRGYGSETRDGDVQAWVESGEALYRRLEETLGRVVLGG